MCLSRIYNFLYASLLLLRVMASFKLASAACDPCDWRWRFDVGGLTALWEFPLPVFPTGYFPWL